MFTTVRPVTQMAETAVKSASARGVISPEADAIGSISNTVVMVIRKRKMKIVAVAAPPPNTAWARNSRPRIPEGAE
jgi:hypothetical protein